MTYTPINEPQAKTMLDSLGIADADELFAHIPENIKLTELLNLPDSLDDMSLQSHMSYLAAKNRSSSSNVSFLGAGSCDHYIPPVVDALANQSTFVTAYTPYQAEASQGALQAFYEYQSMICAITGMDVSNASLYEVGSALAESVLMARDITSKSRVIIAGNIHPEYRQVLDTYLSAQPMQVEEAGNDLSTLKENLDEEAACLIIQQPDFFGRLNPLDKIAEILDGSKALLIVISDPISLGMLRPPGTFGADIVVGEGQPLGIYQSFGGPYLGFLAAKKKYLRRLPGRIIGLSEDSDAKPAFCLTLQTREQHIRRERATSNICSNEGLLAIRAAIYLAAMGKTGLARVAELSFAKAHYAANQIARLKGYELAFPEPFFKEFVVRCSRAPVDTIINRAGEQGIFAGVNLGRWYPDLNDCLLIAVTEKRTKEQIDTLVSILDEIK